MKRSRRDKGFRHPFVELNGEVYLMIDWFELEAGHAPPDRVVLHRLMPAEVQVYDRHRTTAETVAAVLPLVRKRIARPPKRGGGTR